MTWHQKPPLGTPLDWGNPLNKGCVMHLGMLEGMGDRVSDLSMNGNHGKLEGFAYPPTHESGWNPGQTGTGLNFDGTNDEINCGNNASLDITECLTLSALVKKNNLAVRDDIVTKLSSGYNFLSHHDNKLYFQAKDSAGVWRDCSSNANAITDLEWHHVVVSYKRPTASFYVDGVFWGNGARDYDMRSTSGNCLVGCMTPLSSVNHFNGSVDQPRIMNRCWSAKEVMDYAINPWAVYLDE